MLAELRGNVSDFEIGNEYRPVPFWSWNDELDEDELIRQIGLMQEAGIGGFFMHARGGLKTPYCGEKWYDCVSVCVREAVRRGMCAYLYDENGWPSGTANGEVYSLGLRCQQKYLRFSAAAEVPENAKEHLLARYDGRFQLLPAGAADAAWIAWFDVNPYYVDNLDPAVVREFIRCVHERYWAKLPADVRESLTGIFTDEPQISRNGIPWSFLLKNSYENRWDEKLLPHIPEMFQEIGSYRRTRIRYYRLCTEMFRKNYIEQIGKWCNDHGWELVGHHVLEESYDAQLSSNGAIMPQYTGYSIPGNDHLDSNSAHVGADVQLVSVAAQYGKKQILTETFGCSGWNFNLFGMRWLYQQQLVHGINLLCQHLAGYSLHGSRKRDYPASIFYQHPMWPQCKALHDGFARVGRMLTLGKNETSLLMLHGESTAWMDSHGMQGEELTTADFRPFRDLSVELDKAGYPFHYGDETLMEESGSVTGKMLKIGEMSYSTVIIPPMKNLSAAVLKLLRDFAEAGGKLIRYTVPEMLLEYCDGEILADADRKFLASLPEASSQETLLSLLDQVGVPSLRCHALNGAPGQIRGTWRRFADSKERWYFIADFATLPENCKEDWYYHDISYSGAVGDEKDLAAEITLPFPAKRLTLIDQVTGKENGTISHADLPDGGARFCCTLPARGSLLIRAEDEVDENGAIDLSDNWHCQVPANCLVLDRGEYSTDGGRNWSPTVDMNTVFNRMLSLMRDSDLAIRWHFTIADDLDLGAAGIELALEADGESAYELNGQPLTLDYLPDRFYIDHSIKVVKLPLSALKRGENLLIRRLVFRQRPEIRAALLRARVYEGEFTKIFYDSEVEAVYLLGNFAVGGNGGIENEKRNCRILRGTPVMQPLPPTVSCGELVRGGYPFFTGSFTLTKVFTLTEAEAKRLSEVRFVPFKANSITAILNGVELGTVYTAPYRLECAAALKAGENRLTLHLTTSCRNTLGPLHSVPVELSGVGPFNFLEEPDVMNFPNGEYTAEYGILEYGPEKVTLC